VGSPTVCVKLQLRFSLKKIFFMRSLIRCAAKRLAAGGLCLGIGLATQTLQAQNTAPSADTLRTTQVVVFKNGTGFFFQEGTLPVTNQQCTIGRVPQALFGTLWADAPGNGVVSLAGYEQRLKVNKPISTLTEVLAKNIGKRVRVRVLSGNEEEPTQLVEGVLKAANDNYVAIQNANGVQQFLVGTPYTQLDFLDAPTLTAPQDSTAWQLHLALARAATNQRIRLYYLQKNVGWMPAYRIELLANNRARLNLRATFTNDAEDLVNTQVKFTVGIPNFRFQDQVEPVVSGALLGMVMARHSALENYRLDNLAFANVAQTIMPAAGDAEVAGYLDETSISPTNVAESQAQDLFFYEVSGITLPKGGRGNYNLLDMEVDYEDLYEVLLPPNNGYNLPQLGEQSPAQTVWHSIRMKNTGTAPWTTGAALVLDRSGTEMVPISQDQLNYTAPNDRISLKLTTAPDVNVTQEEEEVSRQEGLRLRDRYTYDLVTIRSTLRLKNFKQKEVKLTLKRLIFGESLNSNVDWKVTTVPQSQYGNMPNRQQQLEWEPTLSAGQELEITYTYKMYIRR
jgi:hypothetical protein